MAEKNFGLDPLVGLAWAFMNERVHPLHRRGVWGRGWGRGWGAGGGRGVGARGGATQKDKLSYPGPGRKGRETTSLCPRARIVIPRRHRPHPSPADIARRRGPLPRAPRAIARLWDWEAPRSMLSEVIALAYEQSISAHGASYLGFLISGVGEVSRWHPHATSKLRVVKNRYTTLMMPFMVMKATPTFSKSALRISQFS